MNLINKGLAEVSERIAHETIAKKLQNHERQSGIFAVWLGAFFLVWASMVVWFILHLFGVA